MSSGIFLQEMFVLYLIALLGFLAKKIGVLNEYANDVLTQLILYLTLPALILFSLDISFSFTLMKEFLWLIMMSIYILFISSFLAYWMRKQSKLPEKQKAVYEGLTLFGNQGFIGYAVSFILLGEQGIVYLTMFNLFYLIHIWTYGIYLFSRNKNLVNWKYIFLNPGIISTIIGLIIFLLPVSFPHVISKGLKSVGKMTIPLSMMIIGSLIAEMKDENYFLSLKNRYLWKSAFIKLFFIPLCLLPFTLLVPFPLMVIAVVVSGMPSAPTISLYAQKYGADSFFASLGVLITTILCIVTLPLLYFILDFIYR